MNRKKKIILSATVFFAGLILGLVVFFPISKVKEVITSQVAKATGYDVEIAKISFGTGFGLGFSKGGVFGIKIESLRVVGNTGKTISCKSALIAPHFARLFLLQLSFGIMCDMDDNDSKLRRHGLLKSVLRLSPLYSPSKLNLELELDSVDLVPLIEFARPMIPDTTDLSGVLSGNFSIHDLSLSPVSEGTSKTEIDLGLSNFVLNNIELGGAPLFSMPFNMGKTQILGNFSEGKLSLSKFDFTSEELNGSMSFDMNINKQGFPQAGVLKGKIKTVASNPNRDLVRFLENFFGPIDNSEFREFTKKFENGDFMGFIGKPIE